MTIFRLNFLLKVAHILVCQNPSFISTKLVPRVLRLFAPLTKSGGAGQKDRGSGTKCDMTQRNALSLRKDSLLIRRFGFKEHRNVVVIVRCKYNVTEQSLSEKPNTP